jgi:hypothetical protein
MVCKAFLPHKVAAVFDEEQSALFQAGGRSVPSHKDGFEVCVFFSNRRYARYCWRDTQGGKKIYVEGKMVQLKFPR